MEQEHVIGKMLTKVYDERTPFVGTLEINTTCNFNCIHCYLKGKHDLVLKYSDATQILDEMKSAGTLFLNLTGGEILAHPDFEKIYKYAIEKGFIVTLLTNASLLNDKTRNLLKENPPRKIEITLYGITQDVFQTVTCSNISSSAVLENVIHLKEDGHNILLKMIALKENQSELNRIKEFADKNAIPFQYDFNILPALSGDQSVMKHQLSIDETIALELTDGTDRLKRWKAMVKNYDFDQNKKTNCGCGRFSYAVSADMQLKRCNFIVDKSGTDSLRHNSFSEIWNRWNSEKEPLINYNKCKECIYQPLCDVCPSISFTLGSKQDGHVQRQCDLAKARYDLVKKNENSCN